MGDRLLFYVSPNLLPFQAKQTKKTNKKQLLETMIWFQLYIFDVLFVNY